MKLSSMLSAVMPSMSAEESKVDEFLYSYDQRLMEAYRRHLPRARQAILHRFWQCVLRENIGGLRERMRDDFENQQLIVALSNELTLVATVVRRHSLDRWDIAAPLEVHELGAKCELQRANDLLDLLAKTRVLDNAESTHWFERFRFELDNSTANYALALAGAERRRLEFCKVAAEAGCRTSIEWAERQSARDPQWSPLTFFEQWVIDGHPLHPGTKLKAGMTPQDVMRFSPEWEARPEVRIAAVLKSCCRVSSYQQGGPAEVLRREYPEVGRSVDTCLTGRGLKPSDYEWIPVHPWQFDHTLPDLYAEEIQRGAVVLVPDAIISTAALMAVRSLAPIGVGYRERHHLKTAINVQMTGAVRTVSPQAAENGPMLSAVLAEVQRREGGFADRFVVLLEDVGVHFASEDVNRTDEHHALLGKNLAAVLRENPETYVRTGEVAMPASALLAKSPLGGGPIVGELVERYAQFHGCQALDAIVPFLADYAATTVPGMLTLMTRYGIGLEGHLQNCVLVFRNGTPTRLLVRDMGGVRILSHRLERHGVQVRFLPGSATLALDEEDLRHKVGYAFLQNHWGELIACLARTFDVDERNCWRPLANVCAAEFQRLLSDPICCVDARRDRAAFFAPHLALKALSTMRLRGDVTKYSFSEVTNPLAEFADASA
jgi:siderophore synthetase component